MQKRSSEIFKKKRNVVLWLYLLHHPDYPYGISKSFEEAMKQDKYDGKKNDTMLLKNPNKVSDFLKEMESDGAVKAIEKKVVNGRERVYYNVDPTVFPIFRKEHTDDVKVYVKLIQDISLSKAKCVEKIGSFKRYDVFTIITYLRNLICLMARFNANEIMVSQNQKSGNEEGLEIELQNNKRLIEKGSSNCLKLEKMRGIGENFFPKSFDFLLLLDELMTGLITSLRGMNFERFDNIFHLNKFKYEPPSDKSKPAQDITIAYHK